MVKTSKTPGGRRVVIVDNDPEVIELVCTDLAAEGHEIVGTTTDGAAAIELCQELRPDVLVVDYRMPPGLNGIDVAKRVRAQNPDIAVILYTNYRRPDLQRESDRVGARLLPKGNIRSLRRAVAGS